jgi:hypothetical protein
LSWGSRVVKVEVGGDRFMNMGGWDVDKDEDNEDRIIGAT